MAAITAPTTDQQPRLSIEDSFAFRLRFLRLIAGDITQVQAARATGQRASTWATWEAGNAKPQKMDKVVKEIALGLGCDRGWLMFGGPITAAIPDNDGPSDDPSGLGITASGWIEDAGHLAEVVEIRPLEVRAA